MMKRTLIILVPALLAACTAPGTFPSLAKRPFEKPLVASPEPPVAPALPSDAALLGRIADALKQARDGVAGFETALPAAREAARQASGAGQESDAWNNGQLMVTRLEGTTAPARDALAMLDDERRFLDQHPGSPDLPVPQAAIAEIEAIDARQSGIVRELLALFS